jgi:hypothetical protein
LGLTNVHETSEKGSRCHDDALTVIPNPECRFDSASLAIRVQKASDLALLHIQVGLPFTNPFEAKLVRLLVALSARSPHGGSLFRIQHSKLKTGHIRGFAHFPSHGIDFTREMAFGKPADRGIARHLADTIQIYGEEERLAPHSRGGEGGFYPGMTRATDNHIISLGVNKHGMEL